MIDISSTRIKHLIVHRIGNKIREEGCHLSHGETSRSESVDALILRHYLSPAARSGDFYEFHHESDINLNVVRHYCTLIFANNSSFATHSGAIGKHLYASSSHPNIIGGELIVCLFDDVRVGTHSGQAIGLFRIEGKSSFLDTVERNGDISVFDRTGISLEHIQKGAVIFSNNERVHIVDTLSAKTKYWVDSFLKVLPADDSKFCEKATANFLKSVSQKIKEPNDSVAIGNSIREAIASKSGISVQDIVSLSESYVGRDEIDTILSDIKSNVGRDLPSSLLLDEKRLKRIARNFLSKTEICDGAHVVIAKSGLCLSGLEVERNGKTIRAVISMTIEGE
ncbi:MAG: nucleoid-associated protein [Bacteroidales bacterium]